MVNSVVIILGAALQADGAASPALRRRVETGCRFAAEKDADLLMCGGVTHPEVPMSEAAVMAQLAREMGFPNQRIYREEHSQNTLENAFFASRLIKEKGWARVTIVTQRYHVPRALFSLKSYGISVGYEAVQDEKITPLLFFSYLREVPALLWYGVRVLNGQCRK